MKKLALTISTLAFPLTSFAALGNVSNLVTDIGNLVDKIIPIVFAIGLLVFFWGLVRYVIGGAEDKEKAKNLMIWGVVALFIMASVWGLVNFIGSAVGVGKDSAPTVGNLIPR